MDPNEKWQKEYIGLLAALVDKQEEERHLVARKIHGDVSGCLSIALMHLSKYEKNKITPELYAEIIALINESAEALHVISKNLNPSFLEPLGLIQMLFTSNRWIETNRSIVIHEENEFEGVVPFNFKDQLQVFRIYHDAINYFIDQSNVGEVNLKIYNKNFYFIIEISYKNNGALKVQNDVIRPIQNKNIKVIKTLLLLLNGRVDEKSNDIDFLQINIPFTQNLN